MREEVEDLAAPSAEVVQMFVLEAEVDLAVAMEALGPLVFVAEEGRTT